MLEKQKCAFDVNKKTEKYKILTYQPIYFLACYSKHN